MKWQVERRTERNFMKQYIRKRIPKDRRLKEVIVEIANGQNKMMKK